MSRAMRLLICTMAIALLASGCKTTTPDFSEDDWSEVGASDLTGGVRTVRVPAGTPLAEIARQERVGYVELLAANPGVDPWVPPEVPDLTVPSAHILPSGPREGLIVNLADQRLYAFDADLPVRTYPIGISRAGWTTPQGSTSIVRKRENPVWYPGVTSRRDDPTLGKSVGPGPDNPLGTHALYLDWPLVLIHGTNEPYGIGRRVSRGCIRLYPEDIPELFSSTPVGTPVRVVDEPIKLGRARGHIYLEAHPDLLRMEQIEANEEYESDAPGPVEMKRVRAFVGAEKTRVDWSLVELTLRERRGTPIRITR